MQSLPADDNIVNPKDHDWSQSETRTSTKDVESFWQHIRTHHGYFDDSLSRDALHDDYQQLFVHMLLDHVKELLLAFKERRQAKPMYLFLLGTAGTGKTRAIQTALQEIKAHMRSMDLNLNFVRDFVRPAAPTGSAAFNIRFNASTIHRLIHWFNPTIFHEMNDNTILGEFQEFMQHTQLIILDEFSMVGRQMMGRIDSRLHQAKADTNLQDYDFGGLSCVCAGDLAQCEAIHDQQPYNLKTHPETTKNASAQRVLLSNKGLTIYDQFEHVIVLTTCHRLKTIDEPKSPEENAYNDRADMFLQILHRLRDLKWTFQDYFWLCKRKKSNLSLTEILSFDDAPSYGLSQSYRSESGR